MIHFTNCFFLFWVSVHISCGFKMSFEMAKQYYYIAHIYTNILNW